MGLGEECDSCTGWKVAAAVVVYVPPRRGGCRCGWRCGARSRLPFPSSLVRAISGRAPRRLVLPDRGAAANRCSDWSGRSVCVWLQVRFFDSSRIVRLVCSGFVSSVSSILLFSFLGLKFHFRLQFSRYLPKKKEGLDFFLSLFVVLLASWSSSAPRFSSLYLYLWSYKSLVLLVKIFDGEGMRKRAYLSP